MDESLYTSFKTAAPLQGLINKENNCFINASLQALLSAKAFHTLLQTPSEKEEPLQKSLLDLSQKKQSDTAHSQILDILYSTVPDLKAKRGLQHDARPVIDEILDRLKYKQLFQVTYQGINQYKHLVSAKQNALYVLQIPLEGKRPSLQTLIKNAFARKFTSDENNKWKATSDGKEIALSNYSVTHSLTAPLADMLVVQLERGYWDQSNGITKPANISVQYKDPIVIESSSYTLRACINYHPAIRHYTADVLRDGKWYHCDDTNVQPIPGPQCNQAYIYVLEKTVF